MKLLPPTLGGADFTTVKCTDINNDATCENSFQLLSGVKISLFASEEDLEYREPVIDKKNHTQ